MKYFSYLHMCLVVFTVHGDNRNLNMITDTKPDCCSMEHQTTTRKAEVGDNITEYSLEIPSSILRYSKSNQNYETGNELTGLNCNVTTNCTVVDQEFEQNNLINVLGSQELNGSVSDLHHEEESLEQEMNVTRTTIAATEFMEEFTRATTNATTIAAVTWSYQGNKRSEESDESKSTLIDYPFSASIQKKGAHYASGALLDKFWIITAAGDFYNVRESLKLFRVRLGSVDCKSGGTITPLKKIEIHPYYVYGKPNFDVALIRMAMYVEFNSFTRPIALSEVKGKVLSAKFMTTYWPRILINGLTLPHNAKERVKFNSMRVSTQRLIPDEECTEMMKNVSVILNESSLCLKPIITHHTTCTRDVGAPVLAEDGLWGITSGWTSPLCPLKSSPTIFTRLSSTSVRSWLDSHLQALG